MYVGSYTSLRSSNRNHRSVLPPRHHIHLFPPHPLKLSLLPISHSIANMSTSSPLFPKVISYNVDLTISLYWTTALHVLTYLRDTDEDRQKILDLVQHLTQAQPEYVLIYHPLLNYDIILHSLHNDYHFIHMLNGLIILEGLDEDDKTQATLARHERSIPLAQIG